jgi:2,4-didehydro-3-deoxy-L-rhamnonate hydrolase
VRIANHDSRVVLVIGDQLADIATASDGRFGPDPMSIYADWPGFVDFACSVDAGTAPLVMGGLQCPVPAPPQVFAVGLNYKSHAEESGMGVPTVPATFTKFPACLSGPFDDIEIVGDAVDWEVELVAVMGTRADRVAEADAWSHVAGLTVGQDISDRVLQFVAASQFSLGKSRRGYGPMGPWIVTIDELDNPDDLGLGCSVDGEEVQNDRTGEMLFSVPQIIAELSAILPLLPGDVIFTGTPAGIGVTRQPPKLLRAGQVLESWIEGIGTMRNLCT